MNQDNQRIIDKLKHPDFAEFCRQNNIDLAMLFGSRATGTARENSDFDVAILLDRRIYPADTLARGGCKRTILLNLVDYLASSRIDLVVLNDASSFLVYQIIQTGQVLYEKNPAEFARLASLAIRQYSDGYLFREAEKKYLGGQRCNG
ncbi:type VII toxin-antitoxin system MntA family adenylyltransferase antitoxin [Dethiobacter alkaliphilus]|uniref:type VII toxin-antitoxin system MntA family adenylyltransferase antitoxin n=1 Tax=Dethiobacter alkaliphilus TaxID=427926 RepID=UPI0022278DA5|nr:nucleotidyltransferase domain-containing protein [Dethiobacter alkaliphilus]MCW3488910.1 nucleotidyltransferase domain-containing protein [Dethiobacter alkaliphilus]